MTAQIIPINGITLLDSPADQILDQSKGKLDGCMVLGFDKGGSFYAASSYADGGTALWLLEVCKKILLEAGQ